MKYRVWISLEEIDEEDGHNDRFMYSTSRQFDTLEEATKIVANACQHLIDATHGQPCIEPAVEAISFNPDAPFKWRAKEC